MEGKDRLIVGLNVSNVAEVSQLVRNIVSYVGMFKVGNTLFTAQGPEAIKQIRELGGEVFLDLKYHDTPKTVEASSYQATKLDVRMFTVHIEEGNQRMLELARTGRHAAMVDNVHFLMQPRIIGVTVLTSIGEKDFREDGGMRSLKELVNQRVTLAVKAHLDGVTASPLEVLSIRNRAPKSFIVVVPGIGFAGSDPDDQVRFATPYQAILNGADYIVMESEIMGANDPVGAAMRAADDIEQGLKDRSRR